MHSPLFIVGSPRSGTSILAQAIRRAGYIGYSEGNFLSLLFQFNFSIDVHFKHFGNTDPDVLISHLDPRHIKRRVAEAIREIVEAQYAGQHWLDKTGNPEMIAAIPLLRQIWPSAVFIFAKRRGIENVLSRRQKFPQYDLAYHCKNWAQNMRVWRYIRAAESDLRYLEVDQLDIAKTPDKVARGIGHFLELTHEQEAAIADEFQRDYPQETAPGTALQTSCLPECGWSEPEQQVFRKFCQQEMLAYGYTEDEAYRT